MSIYTDTYDDQNKKIQRHGFRDFPVSVSSRGDNYTFHYQIEYTIDYTYKEYGDLVEEITEPNIFRLVNEYDYDNFGNWIKRIEYYSLGNENTHRYIKALTHCFCNYS